MSAVAVITIIPIVENGREGERNENRLFSIPIMFPDNFLGIQCTMYQTAVMIFILGLG